MYQGKPIAPRELLFKIPSDFSRNNWNITQESVTSALAYDIFRTVLGYDIGDLVPQYACPRGFADFVVNGNHQAAGRTQVFVEIKKFSADINGREARESLRKYVGDWGTPNGAAWKIGVLTNLRHWNIVLSSREIHELTKRYRHDVSFVTLAELDMLDRSRKNAPALLAHLSKTTIDVEGLRNLAISDRKFFGLVLKNSSGAANRQLSQMLRGPSGRPPDPNRLRRDIDAVTYPNKGQPKLRRKNGYHNLLRRNAMRLAIKSDFSHYLGLDVSDDMMAEALRVFFD